MSRERVEDREKALLLDFNQHLLFGNSYTLHLYSHLRSKWFNPIAAQALAPFTSPFIQKMYAGLRLTECTKHS